jgi:hypothetical protein
MKSFLGWTVMAWLPLAGCGGNVVVDGPNGTGGTSTTTTTTLSGSSGGGCASTCALAIMSGGRPCGDGALMAYLDLLSCPCATTNYCSTVCTTNLCMHQAMSDLCAQCTHAYCGSQLKTCEAN